MLDALGGEGAASSFCGCVGSSFCTCSGSGFFRLERRPCPSCPTRKVSTREYIPVVDLIELGCGSSCWSAIKLLARGCAFHEPALKRCQLIFVLPVAHPSLHELRRAIDWNISWPANLNGDGTLKIKWGPKGGPNGEKAGDAVDINTAPRTGLNHKLWQVGRSYGVIKF